MRPRFYSVRYSSISSLQLLDPLSLSFECSSVYDEDGKFMQAFQSSSASTTGSVVEATAALWLTSTYLAARRSFSAAVSTLSADKKGAPSGHI